MHEKRTNNLCTVFFPTRYQKKKKKKKNLRAVNYCTRSGCVLCRIRLPFRASQRNICLTNVWAGPSEALLILIQTHRHWRSISEVGKKRWKYIHYKVVMKSPAGSSERWYFQQPWAGFSLCILHLLSFFFFFFFFYTLIWEVFTFLKATIGSLFFVVIGPVTVLQQERERG